MSKAKAHKRKLVRTCKGCKKEFTRQGLDDHIMNVIRGLRV